MGAQQKQEKQEEERVLEEQKEQEAQEAQEKQEKQEKQEEETGRELVVGEMVEPSTEKTDFTKELSIVDAAQHVPTKNDSHTEEKTASWQYHISTMPATAGDSLTGLSY